tara:strand:+ start:342 stop:554 length:213 start_codon:yes stop_codon:yes gene_type:complete
VKKNNQETFLVETDALKNKNLETKKIKTTNVNILLNRVRLDQKKNFIRRLLLSFLLVALVSSIFVYFLLK